MHDTLGFLTGILKELNNIKSYEINVKNITYQNPIKRIHYV